MFTIKRREVNVHLKCATLPPRLPVETLIKRLYANLFGNVSLNVGELLDTIKHSGLRCQP